jgi:putative DNA primase/helicase
VIDPQKVRESVDIVRLIERYVELKKVGNEYRGLCPFHSDTHPSLWVIPQKQFYYCFSCEESGDCIDFVRAMEGLGFKDAAEKLSGVEFKPLARRKKPAEYEKRLWRSTIPPSDAGEPEIKGNPTRRWTVRDTSGNVLGYTARYDINRDGRTDKLVLQYTWGTFNEADTPGWACRHFSNPVPLYGLERFGGNPERQVLIFEGEKTADAAHEMLAEKRLTCLGFIGGANKAQYADLSPLKEHSEPVVIVADADESGRKAMMQLAGRLIALGCRVKTVDDPERPKGWDVADAKHDGWTTDELIAWLRKHAKPYTPYDDLNPPPEESAPVETELADHPPTPRSRKNGFAALGINFRNMSEIQPKPIKWLWPGKLARGKVSIIAGNPGLGKSQVTASLASIVSNGGLWPVERTQCERGRVIMLSAEDDPEDTIRPRLEAAEADIGMIEYIESVQDEGGTGEYRTRGFSIERDCSKLSEMILDLGDVAMVIIDPITAYLGQADSHKNAEVRALLAELARLAFRHNVAIVAVSHMNKSQSMDALMKVQGSVGFTGAARAVWGVTKDKDNQLRRLFVPLKNNLGKDEVGFAYTIEPYRLEGTDIETSRVMWENELISVDANDAFGGDMDREQKPALDRAQEFLREYLREGPAKVSEVFKDAKSSDCAEITIRRAAAKLGVVYEQQGFGRRKISYWKMPRSN